VARFALRDGSLHESLPHGPLEHGFVKVVPAALAGGALLVEARGGEYPLPWPLATGVRVLAPQSQRQFHPAGAVTKIHLVLLLDHREVPGQFGFHNGRQHGHSILVPLATADGQLVPREVDILHPEVRAFEQPQAGAVEEHGHQAGHAVHLEEEGPNLLPGEHDREPRRALRPDHVVEPWQVLLEDVAIQEEERAQCLVLGRRRHVALDGERAEELRDLRCAHLGRMTLAMEEDEPADPRQIGTLGAPAEMPDARGFPDAVEKSRRARRGWVGLAHPPHGAGRAGIPDPGARPRSHGVEDSAFPRRAQECGGIDTPIDVAIARAV